MNEFIKKYKGHKFGELVVEGPEVLVMDKDGNITQRNVYCHCSCGKKYIVVGVNDLLNGYTTSCGCMGTDSFVRVINSGNMKHGDSKGGIYNDLYIAWGNMKNLLDYRIKNNLISKDITICQEWKDSYDNFKDWALRNDWSAQKSLRRYDSSKGYNPENCYWSY